MAFEISLARPGHDHLRDVPNGRDVDARDAQSEVGALRAENAELRKVVIALSKLVIRNVLGDEARI